MRRMLLSAVCASALLFGFAPTSKTQAKLEKSSSGQNQSKPKIIALNTNDLEAFDYDAGKVKLIATNEDTNGAYAVVELTEMPGYKTAWHQHNNCEEAFYVVEGVLTIQLADKLYEMPAGSYILIPRGTPHGQGNFTNMPVRLLTTFTLRRVRPFFQRPGGTLQDCKAQRPRLPEEARWVARETQTMGRDIGRVESPQMILACRCKLKG